MSHIQYLYQHLGEVIQLSDDDKILVQSLFDEVSIQKGSFLLKEGEICTQLAFVCKGIFRYYIDQDGEDRTYNFAKEGEFVCNYESLIRRSPSPKHIQAIEDTEILAISSENLQRFYREVNEGNLFGRIHMEKIYAETIRQLVTHYTETPEARYLNFLKKHPDLNQR